MVKYNTNNMFVISSDMSHLISVDSYKGNIINDLECSKFSILIHEYIMYPLFLKYIIS